ncbi:hypothetical protein [Sphingomonas paucimobilis]|uniref:hypothetical protein n=1 Tax=Sphingomonas paucimobilis TaxID=13689 RepID=UPI0031E0821F
MASFLELIDNALGTHFNTPVYKPEDGRKKMVKVIDLAAKQHSEGTTRAPNRSWTAGNNNAISFSPKIDGKPVKIGGKETNFVAADHFQDFLSGMRAAVEAGELDKEIKAAIDAPKPAGAASTSTTPRKRSSGAEKPWEARKDYADLTRSQKQSVSRLYNNGKNPDGSLIKDHGHNPDAPLMG